MSSNLLTWLSSSLIALLLGVTLWLAHAVHPEQDGSHLLMAQAAEGPAVAASAPLNAR
jgi:hypothetical protein